MKAVNMEKKRIVVIGGGFAGLNFIKRIDKKQFDVTLIDANNYHSFPPLFYQVASSGLEPASIAFPFRREMRKRRAKGTNFNLGRVSKIDFGSKRVITDVEAVPYDILVVAAGTTNNFFGNAELTDKVYTIKSVAESIRCRNDILARLERAAVITDDAERRRMLSFVVVGGGPTGVEIAGAIGEMKRYILRREYPTIDPNDVTVTLLEGTDRLLRTMSEKSSTDAEKYLKALMVNVRLGSIMKSYGDSKLTLSDGTQMDAGMVIWTAGVTGVTFDTAGASLPITRGGRIEVDNCNRVKGFDDVYALGDISYMDSDPAWPNGHPQLAQVAIQQARNLARCLNKNEVHPFVYKDKGSMATVGRNRAVVEIKGTQFGGFMAWLTWMFVHLITLLGMRNKVAVLVNWLWAYFTYSTSLRLILHPSAFPRPDKYESGT